MEPTNEDKVDDQAQLSVSAALKAKVTEIMGMVRRFRHADRFTYDKAYRDVELAVYAALGAPVSHDVSVEPRICYEHGPWLNSSLHADEQYCERCGVRLIFRTHRKCEPHIIYSPREDL